MNKHHNSLVKIEFVELPEYLLKISRCGIVVNTKSGKVFKGTRDKYGYLRIYATQANKKRKGLFVHRLLSMAFIPNPDNRPCVNHKDGNKTNNDLGNLEWCTHKENTAHAIKLGLIKHVKGYVYENKIKRNEAVRTLYSTGKFTYDEIGEFFHLHGVQIGYIVRGKESSE